MSFRVVNFMKFPKREKLFSRFAFSRFRVIQLHNAKIFTSFEFHVFQLHNAKINYYFRVLQLHNAKILNLSKEKILFFLACLENAF